MWNRKSWWRSGYSKIVLINGNWHLKSKNLKRRQFPNFPGNLSTKHIMKNTTTFGRKKYKIQYMDTASFETCFKTDVSVTVLKKCKKKLEWLTL